MTKPNAQNERIKRTYFAYLREAHGRDVATIDSVAKSLTRFEDSTKRRDFKRFHREQAVAFKAKLTAELTLLALATGAQHVLARWRSSGGVVAPIRSVSYPDERFRTKLMWWDRRAVARHAAHSQNAKIIAEMADTSQCLHNSSRHAPAGG